MQTKLVKETIEEVTDVSGACNISTGGGKLDILIRYKIYK